MGSGDDLFYERDEDLRHKSDESIKRLVRVSCAMAVNKSAKKCAARSDRAY